MMNSKSFLTFVIALLMISGITNAEEKPPKFQVEIIVFETFALKSWTEEYWPHDPEPMDTEETIYLKPLEPENFLLKEQADKMTAAGGYRILYHQSWIMDGDLKENTQPVLVFKSPNKGETDSRLEGSIHFWKSRFPHVWVNLELERKIPNKIRQKFAEHEKLDEQLMPDYWRFNINESRKINTGQLHYIDHPVFGALVAIKYRPDLSEEN